jgi:ABC-type branched-subunit amino acid transport system substrate-binding protein
MSERPSVGLSLSLSGAHAAIGRQADPAIKLFVEDRNAAGGVNVGGRA